MPLASAEIFSDILMKMSILRYVFKSRSKRGLFDLNKQAEYFFCKFLNSVYGWSLVDLNHENMNAAAIDLADSYSRVCVQVTAQDDASKIKATISKFIELELYMKYDRLIILMIAGKKSYTTNFDTQDLFDFDKNSDIWDIDDVLSDVEKLELYKAKELASFVNDELQPIVKALAPSGSLLSAVEPKVNSPPKTSKSFINFIYDKNPDSYDEDVKKRGVKKIKKLYIILSNFSRKTREYLLLYVLRGRVFGSYESESFGFYWKDLHNILSISDDEATNYFGMLNDVNLVSHDDEYRVQKLFLHYRMECDLDFFICLNQFCNENPSLIKEILVDCNFALLD